MVVKVNGGGRRQGWTQWEPTRSMYPLKLWYQSGQGMPVFDMAVRGLAARLFGINRRQREMVKVQERSM